MTSLGYDDIADWYDDEFVAKGRTFAALGVTDALRELLGPGTGPCLEIGSGTGVHAATVGELGWTPIGVDLSAGMLTRSRGRLPSARADAEHLPVSDAALPAAVALLVHTDMPGYPAVLREAARVLRPGGAFVHVGVHPCFCGGFADRTDPAAVVVRPGYLDQHWTTQSWTDNGIRDKVGASHLPLAELLNAVTAAGLRIERWVERGSPTPMVLAFRAVRA